MKPHQVIYCLFVTLALFSCGNADLGHTGSIPGDDPAPFYADLRAIVQSQTGLGHGIQTRSFPVWHLRGPWDDASKALFRQGVKVVFSDSASLAGRDPQAITDFGLTWQDVQGEPNMSVVTLSLPLSQTGAYTVDIGAWCQRPEWLPWPTVGEIHVPPSSRPWQSMCQGSCAFSLAPDSCPGLGDIRVLDIARSPPRVRVEVTFSEALDSTHQGQVQFYFTERCYPVCDQTATEPQPLSATWPSAQVAVVEVAGAQAEKLLTNVTSSEILAALAVRSPTVGLGVPHELHPAPDGKLTCKLSTELDGVFSNVWSFPEAEPSGACTIWTTRVTTVNPYPEPTEASREQGHPNPYLLPADTTP